MSNTTTTTKTARTFEAAIEGKGMRVRYITVSARSFHEAHAVASEQLAGGEFIKGVNEIEDAPGGPKSSEDNTLPDDNECPHCGLSNVQGRGSRVCPSCGGPVE